MEVLREKYRKLLNEAHEITVLCESDGRGFTADEKQKIEALLYEAKEVKGLIEAAKAAADMSAQIAELSSHFEQSAPSGEVIRPGGGKAARTGTIGEQFVNSPEYQGWLKEVAPSGVIGSGIRRFRSPPVKINDLLKLMTRKALITGADPLSAGAFVETDYTGIYEPLGRYALRVVDLISRRTTGSDLVSFVRQTVQVTEATPVPEANVTDFAGGTGEVSGEKPEGESTWVEVTEPVKTIAVWIPATKRALADVSQLRGLIDQELRDDLAEELEDQIINGNGVGENFTGLINVAGVLLQAWNADILTTSRQGITNLLVNGRSRPTAWVINPADWETIELAQDGDNRFYYNGPQNQGPAVLWGVPVVQSQTQVEGTAILGDWRKAVMWDRQVATVTASDSHEDFFIRNMVAILAELRAAFALIRPSAFVIVDMTV